MQAPEPGADSAAMDAGAFRAAMLAVNSAAQRHALMYACERVLDSAEGAGSASSHECGFHRPECKRHIDEALALEAELERGCSTVAVGLGIAGRVGASLAELIEAEMRERAACAETAPAGAQIRHAAGIMWTLVALDAEVEREILPVK